jgi:hypothetical protein
MIALSKTFFQTRKRMELSISAVERKPDKAIVSLKSEMRFRRTVLTPSSPATAKP